MKQLSKVVTVIICIFFTIQPLLYLSVEDIFMNEVAYCITLIFCSSSLTILILIQLLNHKYETRKINITIVDIAIGLFLLWGIINITITNKWIIDIYALYKWTAMLSCYLLIRYIPKKQMVAFALLFSGTIQSSIAIIQKIGLASSNHSIFDVTGSFGNPGQLGGYLTVCLTISLCLLHSIIHNKNRIVKFFILLGCFVQIYGLLLSDSRAGFVALVIGVTIWFTPYIAASFKENRMLLYPLIGLVIVVCTLIYNYRPASANARLLIWRVSMDMIADNPILGHGINGFSKKYMLYQADFFEKSPTSLFATTADNVSYPFNELLNITISQGIIGLLLLLLVFFFAFAQCNHNIIARIFKAGLAALLGFSLFSYPSNVFSILILFPICLGNIEGRSIFQFNFSLDLRILCISILALNIWHAIQTKKHIKKISFSLTELYRNPNAKNHIDIIDHLYDSMKYNLSFSSQYMSWLNSRPDMLINDKRIEDVTPSCEGYCLLGKHYQANNDKEMAEYTFRKASNMVPTRIRPKYYLWELYVMENEVSKAKNIASEILEMPGKVESIYTLRIKSLLKKYLE